MVAKRVGASVLLLAAGMRGCYPCLAAKNDNQERRSSKPQKSKEKGEGELEEDWGCRCRATARKMIMRSGQDGEMMTRAISILQTASFDASLEDYRRRELLQGLSLRG